MAYTPDNLEQLRRTFVADRSSVRWVQEHQLVTIDNVATWRPQMIATPPTITMVAAPR
jgi:hypothetical protein